MKHIAKIAVEFLRVASEWDDMGVEEQREYLKKHRKSKRKMTAKPKSEPVGLMEKIDDKRKSLEKLSESFTSKSFNDSIEEIAKSAWKEQDEDVMPESIAEALAGDDEAMQDTLDGVDSIDDSNLIDEYKKLSVGQKKDLQDKLKIKIIQYIKERQGKDESRLPKREEFVTRAVDIAAALYDEHKEDIDSGEEEADEIVSELEMDMGSLADELGIDEPTKEELEWLEKNKDWITTAIEDELWKKVNG